MKVAVLTAPNGHYKAFAAALAEGITASGDQAVAVLRQHRYLGYDAVACWGWRTGRGIRRYNPDIPILVLERGYVGDRFHWTSLGWNGLNGNAIFPKPLIRGARHLPGFGVQPWRHPDRHTAENSPGYALILGQVQSDQACINVNLAYQYRAWHDFLARDGHKVKFRPHPKALRQPSGLPRANYTTGTLAEDLAGAKFTVSWNSNSSVDSVLAGVPSVTLDRGAMAYPVTSHDLANPVTMPSRTEWAAQLAWCQWQPAELSDGTAWKAVREVMP